MTRDNNEEYIWGLANNIYTLIVHRDETDSWRDDVIEILTDVFDAGYWEGRA